MEKRGGKEAFKGKEQRRDEWRGMVTGKDNEGKGSERLIDGRWSKEEGEKGDEMRVWLRKVIKG